MSVYWHFSVLAFESVAVVCWTVGVLAYQSVGVVCHCVGISSVFVGIDDDISSVIVGIDDDISSVIVGIDDESQVGFHEHIFLEHHLTDFPQKGPIRHFMELVCVGLSKNPYFSAQEKRDHITWFQDYFKDKYHLIDDMSSSTVHDQSL